MEERKKKGEGDVSLCDDIMVYTCPHLVLVSGTGTSPRSLILCS